MMNIKMVHISAIIIAGIFVLFVLFILYNKNTEVIETINVNVPKFMDDYTTSYSTFDKNGTTIMTDTLPNGQVSTLKLKQGYLEINIKQISTGQIIRTYNYRGTIGVSLTLEPNNTLNLPNTIVTIINEIPTQITLN